MNYLIQYDSNVMRCSLCYYSSHKYLYHFLGNANLFDFLDYFFQYYLYFLLQAFVFLLFISLLKNVLNNLYTQCFSLFRIYWFVETILLSMYFARHVYHVHSEFLYILNNIIIIFISTLQYWRTVWPNCNISYQIWYGTEIFLQLYAIMLLHIMGENKNFI